MAKAGKSLTSNSSPKVISEARILEAFDAMMKACDLHGERGTAELFWVLSEAMERVAEDKWHVVERSYKEGLCYDARFLMAEAIIETMAVRLDGANQSGCASDRRN
jgi:hypothetical protein